MLLAAALGVAAGIVSQELESNHQHMQGLRDSLQHQLLQHFGRVRTGWTAQCLCICEWQDAGGRVCMGWRRSSQPDRTEYSMLLQMGGRAC